ncbi:hypothetical protein CC80DRAFT_595117 [Byssothecium circinans]|uniref:F-box domain-containing protein n=1 Tax=Byssothecium circinans TaxID=147558 RepID=A0A6A5TRK0_9PLEO|nr:hypothetical protein CC80DRAFT_595117 [Byssothecium circinans]
MGFLLQLPDELLLRSSSFLDKQQDRYNLVLVCRRLQPIGEEVLYTHPEIPRSTVEHNNKHSIPRLLHTLLHRFGLSKRVRSLKIFVISRRIQTPEPSHLLGPRYFSSRTLDDTIAAAQGFLKEIGVGENARWYQSMSEAWETALAAVLIAVPRNLEVLDFGGYRPANWLSPTFGMVEIPERIEPIDLDFDHMFQYGDGGLPLTSMPGLAGIKVIRSRQLMAKSFLMLPTLREIHVSIIGPRHLDDVAKYKTSLLPQQFLAITSLILDCSHEIFLPVMYRLHPEEFLASVAPELHNLRHLTLRLMNSHYWGGGRQPFPNLPDARYEEILQTFKAAKATLETLVVEPGRFLSFADPHNTGYGSTNLKLVPCMTSLQEFSKLRRVVLPLEAVYAGVPLQNGDVPFALLPASIEVLETIRQGTGHLELDDMLLAAKKVGSMPNLRELVVHGDFLFWNQVLSTAWTGLEGVGVRVKLGCIGVGSTDEDLEEG